MNNKELEQRIQLNQCMLYNVMIMFGYSLPHLQKNLDILFDFWEEEHSKLDNDTN